MLTLEKGLLYFLESKHCDSTIPIQKSLYKFVVIDFDKVLFWLQKINVI